MKIYKYLIIILLFVIIPSNLLSQTVSATFFNLPQQKVYLNAVEGLYVDVIDSVMMSHDKRVEFNNVIPKGMYQLETEFGHSVDFLYDNAQVKMLVKDIYDINSIVFIDSQINKDWYAYQNIKEHFYLSIIIEEIH